MEKRFGGPYGIGRIKNYNVVLLLRLFDKNGAVFNMDTQAGVLPSVLGKIRQIFFRQPNYFFVDINEINGLNLVFYDLLYYSSVSAPDNQYALGILMKKRAQWTRGS